MVKLLSSPLAIHLYTKTLNHNAYKYLLDQLPFYPQSYLQFHVRVIFLLGKISY